MLKNYFKIAWRNLLKQKGYAIINLTGLAVGISCCLMILLFVQDEMSYDLHHPQNDQLYRVGTIFEMGDVVNKTGISPVPLGPAIAKDFPEVAAATRIYRIPFVETNLLKYEDRSFFEDKGIYADSNFFDLLSYDFLEGNPNTALDQPNTVVISDKIAAKLFKEASAIGKIINIQHTVDQQDYKVTGVFKTGVHDSYIDGDYFASINSGSVGREYGQLQEWGGLNICNTFVRLKKDVDPQAFEKKLPIWLKGYAGARLAELGIDKTHFLFPVKDIYLKSESRNWFGGKGNLRYLYLLLTIAGFVLLIACINFINLLTARASLRAPEVGIRKVMGADRKMLIQQFMSESFLYAFLAIGLAFLLSSFLLPGFNQFTGKVLSFNTLSIPTLLAYILGFLGLTTLITGAYPAIYLSRFQPVRIIKDDLGSQLSAQKLRQLLVVFQFIIAIGLIQGVLVIKEQFNFIDNKELGFNKEGKLVIPLNTSTATDSYEILRQQLLKNKYVKAAGGTSNHPGIQNPSDFGYYREGQSPDEAIYGSNLTASPEYMELMGFELEQGRLFDPKRMADTSRTAVITATTVRRIGFAPDDVLGKTIKLDWDGSTHDFEVIGVIKDFHHGSLHHPVSAQVFDWSPNWPYFYLVTAVDTRNMPDLLASLEADWKTILPNEPFQYHFLDEQIQKGYQADQQLRQLITYGAFLAIFICCLGLLGLATFSTERRGKEISIRKILGASVGKIIGLLSIDFLKLVFIAGLITTPFAWWMMNRWLDNFTYRTTIPWWIFLVAGLLALVITILVVGWQSGRAARRNPVARLKE